MAKYTVKMSCGHEEMVELLGKNADRQRKIEYFESSGLYGRTGKIRRFN